jgi:DNA phosphorothioation-dependent restriction protein DptH
MRTSGQDLRKIIAINPSRLTAEDWPYVLSIGTKSGSMYVKKIFQIIKKTQYDEDFGLEKIKSHIDASELNPNQKSFASMRLETLQDYLEGGDFLKNLQIGGVNIFDLRKIMMEPDDIFSVMMLVISSLLNDTRTEREQFVFVINEAHDYLRKGLSKDFTDYINYLIRKKRHAGTWLMLDTHFPEDVDPKVIKGSDIKILHKSDVISSNLLKQIVEGTPVPPHQLETGQAIIRADKSNLGPDEVLIVQVRPRLTHHGGATKTAV